jgi:hypothetical protein
MSAANVTRGFKKAIRSRMKKVKMQAVKAKLMNSFSERSNLFFVGLGSGDQHQRGLTDFKLRLISDLGNRNLVIADKSAIGAAQISEEYFFITHFNGQVFAGNFLVWND